MILEKGISFRVAKSKSWESQQGSWEKTESCLSLIIVTWWLVSRCFEVFCIYCQSSHIEEPYVSITKKRQMPKNGFSEEIEKEVGQAEGKLFTHRSAFSRASVIQAFLGSAPQLTLQLYISTLQQHITVGRCMYIYIFYFCLHLVIKVGGKTQSLFCFRWNSGECTCMCIKFWVCVPITKLKT